MNTHITITTLKRRGFFKKVYYSYCQACDWTHESKDQAKADDAAMTHSLFA